MEKNLRQRKINLVKIVLFGPESTGKTTLSKALAKHYNTVWVEEYARPYLQEKWDKEKLTCEPKDIMPIAYGQMKLENEQALKANKVLICDTDLLETKVYSEEYYGGYVNIELDKAAIENNYDLYLLTYIDTPWEADDLRDKPEERQEMFDAFKKALVNFNKSYLLVKGTKEERFKKAIKAIDKILINKNNLYSNPNIVK